MDVRTEFVGVGANRVAHALDWGPSGLIAYGAHHMVAVYDPKNARVCHTLVGHTGIVNCTLWLGLADPDSGAVALASGASDNEIRIWVLHPTSSKLPWECVAVLQGHSGPVTSLAAYHHTSAAWILVSAAGDPNVIIWNCGSQQHGTAESLSSGVRPLETATAAASTAALSHAAAAAAAAAPAATQIGSASVEVQTDKPSPGREDTAAGDGSAALDSISRWSQDQWRLVQRLHEGSALQHALALTHLPHDPDWLLLAMGGTDKHINLLLRGPGGTFQKACSLLGHENWVRGLAFCHVPAHSAASAHGEEAHQLLLASASQDRYARVWTIQLQARAAAATAATVDAGLDPAGDGADAEALSRLIMRYAPAPRLQTDRHTYTATSSALLMGHEDWVYSVAWRPSLPAAPTATANSSGSPTGGGNAHAATAATAATAAAAPLPGLLTASMDRSMILWGHEASSGLWMNESTVGDAGASCLGYFGGTFSPDGRQIVAHGFTGGLHLWQCGSSSDADGGGGSSISSSSYSRLWQPQHALGGHFGSVVDVCWGADGACLQSVSEDQTARLWTSVGDHWCEVARTQVHGHNFSSITNVPLAADGSRSYCYCSGSDEKMIRVFEAPQAFLDTLSLIRPSVAGGSNSSNGLVPPAPRRRNGMALGAAVAALGLSNKALYEDDGPAPSGAVDPSCDKGFSSFGVAGDGSDMVPSSNPAAVAGPPLEEHLCQNTLWPEVQKLYGHGNEVHCLAASPDGKLLASACRAQSSGAAAIWLWDTSNWQGVAQLQAHTLTVTRLAWSHDSSTLLSASRDRSFAIFQRQATAQHSIAQPLAGIAAHQPPSAAAAAELQSTIAPSAAQQPVSSALPPQHEYAQPPLQQQPQPQQQDQASFSLITRVKNAHARVIWGVAWAPDDTLFATGARDELVKIWCGPGSNWPSQDDSAPQDESSPSSSGRGRCGGTSTSKAAAGKVASPLATLPRFASAVTALAFAGFGSGSVNSNTGAAGVGINGSSRGALSGGGGNSVTGGTVCYSLAVGLESGHFELWRLRRLSNSAVADASGSVGSGRGDGTGRMEAKQHLVTVTEKVWSSSEFQRASAAVRTICWRTLGQGEINSRHAKGSGGRQLHSKPADAGAEGSVVLHGSAEKGSGCWQLALCSDDHSVRILSVAEC